jgi:hypothetical protein
MAQVLSASQFFNQIEDPNLTALREALIAIPYAFWNSFSSTKITESKFTDSDYSRILNHQCYLLQEYDDINVINANENALIRHKYDPMLLSEVGTYKKAITYVESLNESLLSKIGDLVDVMTEGGSAWGWVQFLLDIIGLVPASWIGFPIDTAANLLNACISWYRGNFLMVILNLVACFDVTRIFAPLKFGIKATGKIIPKMFEALGKGASGKAVGQALKADAQLAKNPGILTLVGKLLGSVSQWLAKTGLTLLRSIMPSIAKTIDKLTFGTVKASTIMAKSTAQIDTLVMKLEKFGVEAQKASTEILSKNTAKAADRTVAASAKGAGDAAADAAAQSAKLAGTPLTPGAKNMVSGFTAQTILNKVGKVGNFSDKIVADIAASPAFLKIVQKGASPAIQKNFIYKEATRQLAENILSKKVGLLSITKNKVLMNTLANGGSWKGADKLIASALKKGSPEELGKIMTAMLADPEFFKLISKTSPNITKTIALFKEMPEVLINGAKAFPELARMGSKFVAKNGYRRLVLSNFLVFMAKQAIKTECGQYIQAGTSAAESFDRLKQTTAEKMPSIPGTQTPNPLGVVVEVLASVPTGQEPQVDIQQLSAESLAQFKANDPEGYAQLAQTTKDMQDAANKVKTATNLTNPCYGEAALAEAEVGALYNANKAWHEGQVTTDIQSPEDMDREGLTATTKSALAAIQQDTNIEPQHPLKKFDSETKAYFADVVAGDGKIMVNEDNVSRLDAVLDDMIKNGYMEEADREDIKRKAMEHWTNGTVPTALTKQPIKPEQANESMFKIGKLITKR